MPTKILYNSTDISRTIKRLSREIIEKNKGLNGVCLVGIQTKGVPLAKRLQRAIYESEGIAVDTGSINVSLHRDDLVTEYFIPDVQPNDLEFSLKGKTIVLCDDVLYTGRTVRAAIDAIFEITRPGKIQLLVLCDRGGHEVPVRADFVGKNIPASSRETVRVVLSDNSDEDRIEIGLKGERV